MLELVAAEPYTLLVKNSRFLAELFPVATQEEARARLAAQKTRWPDIRHVVHAFAIGPQANILGCSDDGEPAGTAGRPALEVLKGSGITNIIVLIIRYFGGTLLGTGGLVKAYGDSTKLVLDGIQTEELVEKTPFSMTIGYEMYESTKRILASVNADSVKEDFGTEITISGQIPVSAKDSLVSQISDLSNGRRQVSF